MKPRTERKLTIPAIAWKGEKALKAAVAEIVAEHRRTGRPLAVWHDGKAVLMPPDKAVLAVRESRAGYKTRKNQAI